MNIHSRPDIEKNTTNKGSGVKINEIFINIFKNNAKIDITKAKKT